MSAEEKGKINSRMEDLKQALELGDVGRIKSAKAEMEKTIQEFSTRLYQQAGADAGQPGPFTTNGPTSEGTSDGDTVDAEFTDKGTGA